MNAFWFDEVGRSRRALADPEFADETDEQVSVVEVFLNRGEVELDGARLDEEQWLELELGAAGSLAPSPLPRIACVAPPGNRRNARRQKAPQLCMRGRARVSTPEFGVFWLAFPRSACRERSVAGRGNRYSIRRRLKER